MARQRDLRLLDRGMNAPWLLLIYTVPAKPTRKRAYIWREVKKIGAVYLRDGVCALPERPETLKAVEAIASRVREFDGEATVVTGATFDIARSEAVIATFKSGRLNEYAEVRREAERLLEHISCESNHREFTFAELEELEEDLAKVKRWMKQVQARDYFPDMSATESTGQLLAQCDAALAEFLEETAARDGSV
jgi:Protein ChrB, N-terminal